MVKFVKPIYEPKGQGFESLAARQKRQAPARAAAVSFKARDSKGRRYRATVRGTVVTADDQAPAGARKTPSQTSARCLLGALRIACVCSPQRLAASANGGASALRPLQCFSIDVFRCAERDVPCGRDVCFASDVRFAHEKEHITSLCGEAAIHHCGASFTERKKHEWRVACSVWQCAHLFVCAFIPSFYSASFACSAVMNS